MAHGCLHEGFRRAGLLPQLPVQVHQRGRQDPLALLLRQFQPRLLVILADDLGYGDVQCNNPERGKIPTPHIDKLARRACDSRMGIRPRGVCSPSRYTLAHRALSLAHAIAERHRRRVWRAVDRAGSHDHRHAGETARLSHGVHRQMASGLGLARSRRSSVRLLSQQPAMKRARPTRSRRRSVATEQQIAAWRDIFSKPIAGGPSTRGFDLYFGTDVPNWPPFCFIENDRTLGIPTRVPAAAADRQQPGQPARPGAQGLETRRHPAGARRPHDPVHRRVRAEEGTLPPLHAAHLAAHAARGESGVEGQEPSQSLRRFRDGDGCRRRSRARCAGEKRRGGQHARHLHRRQRLRALHRREGPRTDGPLSERPVARLQGGRVGRRASRAVHRALARRGEAGQRVQPARASGRLHRAPSPMSSA